MSVFVAIVGSIVYDTNTRPHIVNLAEASSTAEVVQPVEIEVQLEVVYNWDKEKIIEEIKKAFPEDPQTAVKIAKCESGLIVDIQSKHILSYGQEKSWGIFQLHEPVWDRKAKQLGYGDYKTSPRDNIDMARYIYEQSGKKWTAWSCYTKKMI
jgi:hypothetical protein